jgi:GNAT superfamily N-acetyltransferase
LNHSPRELEEIALTAWPALEQWLYDGWVVRFAGGYTKRAHAATPLYPAERDPLPKIAQCEAWYEAHGLPTIFRLPGFGPAAELDALLEARGYRLVDPSLTLHRRLDSGPLPGELRGTLRGEALPDWLAHYQRLSGGAAPHPAHVTLLQATPTPRLCAALWDGGQVVACAVGIRFAHAVSIVDVVTAPQQRNRGYGASLIAQLLQWAQGDGATDATLQVQGDNAAARALYARCGFQEAYPYWYRVRP